MAKQEATLLLKIEETGSAALSKTKDLLEGIGSAAKWVGAAVVGFAALALKNYREQELALNTLNQSMVNAGIYTEDLSKKYQAQASALQKLTTFGDEQILAAQAALQAQIGHREVTEDLTRATLDLAQAQGMDLKSAADLVGKSIGSSTNALARYGIEINSAASTSERMSQIISGLNSKFGGQAEAAAQGLGSIKQLQNAFSDVLEVVGEKLAPAIGAGAKVLTNWLYQLGNSKQFLDALDQSLTVVTKGFVYLKTGIMNVGGVIGTALAASMESVSLLMEGQFKRAKDVAALGIQEVGNVIKENMAAQDEELAMIDEQKRLAAEAKRVEEEALIAASEARKTSVLSAEKQKQLALDKKAAEDKKKLDAETEAKLIASRGNFLSHMASLQSSSNSALVAIGKAAAIAQITIATAQAAADGFKWGMAMGGIGLAYTFQGLAYAAGAAQIAQVSGVKLAEGGIIPATQGGVPAIIGEGGRDEAVIPLEDGQVPGSGGVSIVINGHMIGDESSLYMLAKMLDPQFLKLRQNNESVSFDTGVL